ncbi:MAG: UDP-2,3-diacylglucosamine diphosphatase LpxI [Firmicutes bacterium]|nr:UDP-2,3-diacylglucosamine diphosphatase LpxI [Bacillota bacterium]
MSSASIGILAGIGQLPVLAAQSGKAKGLRCVVVSLFPDDNPELKVYADAYYQADPSRLGEIIEIFQREGVTELVLLGKVTKELLYSDFRPDAAWLSLLQKVENKSDDALLFAVVQEFAAYGIKVLPQNYLFKDLLARPGVYTRRKPTPEELQDLFFGYPQAKVIAGLDIGQTLVVSGGAVMAVEAIEGTNQAILRGGELARGSVTVIKVAKPAQDQRFDIPTIGYDTVESVVRAGGGVIAVEAGKVFFVERAKALEYAEAHSVCICAFNPEAARVGRAERLWEEE